MQIEVSATRVMDKLAAKLGEKEAQIARLEATNEVLIERLRAYDERDRLTTVQPAPQAVDDGHVPPTGS